MTIHDNLRQLRHNSGLTQEQVAEKIGVTRQALSSYESGRTRPDIEMLMRLSEIYGTDLDGILYGQAHQLKAAQQIHTTAKTLFLLLSILITISSAILWSTHHFFPISEGQLSAEELLLFATRQKFSHAWEVTDRIILTCAFWGGFLLLILLITGRSRISPKTKLKYIAALSAVLFAVAFLFGIADPAFPVINYVITPVYVIGKLVAFLIADLIIEHLQHGKKTK